MDKETETSLEEKTKEAFVIVGQFVMGCGAVEQSVNYLVEQNFSSKSLIDKIQAMPVVERWKIVKENIPEHISMGNDVLGRPISEKIAEIDNVIQYYVSYVQPTRNILAHSNLESFDASNKVYVSQSRRHKKNGKDLVDPFEILKISGNFYEKQLLILSAVYKFGINGTGWQKGVERTRPKESK